MKKTMFLLPIALMLWGCGSSEPVKKTAPKLTKTEELKRKANVAEAASLVGYDGKKIKQDLNKIIDASNDSQKQLEGLNDM